MRKKTESKKSLREAALLNCTREVPACHNNETPVEAQGLLPISDNRKVKTSGSASFAEKSKTKEIRALRLDKPWLNTLEAAAYLGRSEGALRNMRWRNQVYAHKKWGRLMFKKAELDQLIERS